LLRGLIVGARGVVAVVDGFEGPFGGVEVGVCADCGGDPVAVQLSADRFDDVGQDQAGAVGVLLLVHADQDGGGGVVHVADGRAVEAQPGRGSPCWVRVVMSAASLEALAK
jgi:hypothetical protein